MVIKSASLTFGLTIIKTSVLPNIKIKTKGKYDIDNLDENAFVKNDNLIECNFCGRKFLEDRINVHQKICSKHPEMFIKNKK